MRVGIYTGLRKISDKISQLSWRVRGSLWTEAVYIMVCCRIFHIYRVVELD